MNPATALFLRQRIAEQMFVDYDFTGEAGVEVATIARAALTEAWIPSFCVSTPVRDGVMAAGKTLPELRLGTDEPTHTTGVLFFDDVLPFDGPTVFANAWDETRHGRPAPERVDVHGLLWAADSHIAERAAVVLLLIRYPLEDAGSYPVPGPLLFLDRGLINDSSLAGFEPMIRFVLALWRFMDQRIVVTRTEELPRGARRAAERSGTRTPEFQVIELRRREGERNENPQHVGREWAYQWAVRGHWRNQWYPSAQEHRPRWIDPYLKGPEDKPLVVRPTVFEVRR